MKHRKILLWLLAGLVLAWGNPIIFSQTVVGKITRPGLWLFMKMGISFLSVIGRRVIF